MPRLDTLAVHAGAPRIRGAMSFPIFQAATYSEDQGVVYGRWSNTPSHEHLHTKLAALCGGEAALVCASGMAAISATLLAHLSPGDHLLAPAELYGGTLGLLGDELRRLGIVVDTLYPGAPQRWHEAVGPRTRAVYVESLSNPLVEVTDLVAIADLARAHGLLSIVDNTFLSPVNLRPLELGFDVEVHSATKYLNGHSDVVAGCVVGRAEPVGRAAAAQRHLGGSLDAHACFLLDRGLKTLGLRVRRQNSTAARLADVLAGHPTVARVHYPTRADHPVPPAMRPLVAGWGGVLAFDLADAALATPFLAGLRVATHAVSLGGVDTLVTLPKESTHGSLTREQRLGLGIGDGLVRVACGVEDPDDLVEDLTRALDAAR